ncbi:MAG: hypothetical protein V7K14_11680 [Nostoc sp.]|uniref:hypothetical protein n=1 Tax=Nostoc sp. TaxID=1180 RepID=UPI002FF4FF6D
MVQQVRSRIHDSIQSLHGVMPLWGIDHWVPLGDLFVDVNILESLSSSRRSKLDDLWQDFTTGNSSYRSLDRIGLGKEQQRVSGLTVLERNTNLMVVGKPGSGKTTYLQRIVTECNARKLQAQRIPVLIKLRDSRGVLGAIASQHGLLIERAHKVWSFSHLTFQEYLVDRTLPIPFG